MDSVSTSTRYDFDTDTACTPLGDHEYGLELTDRWNTPADRPNGGYLIGTCLQALRQELPLPDVLSASAHYLRPGSPGPARIRTDIARIGRRTATGQAILTRDDREILRVLATFTDLSAIQGPTLIRSEPPILPPPEDCLDPLASNPLGGNPLGANTSAGMTARLSYRWPQIPGFWLGTPGNTTSAEFWMRFTDGREPDPLALASLVDGAIPVIFDIGVYTSSTIELTVHIRQRPAPGWLACRVNTKFLINGFHEEDFEIWDSTGALVAQSRQLALVG